MGFNPRPLFDKIPVGREIFLDDLIVYPRKRRGRIRNFANQYIGLSSTGTAKSPRRKEAEDDKTESFGVRVSPRSCPSVFRFSQVTWQAEALLFRETKLYWISILESLLVKLIFTSTGFSTSYQYLKLALLMLCVAAQSGRSNHPKMPIFLIALFFFCNNTKSATEFPFALSYICKVTIFLWLSIQPKLHLNRSRPTIPFISDCCTPTCKRPKWRKAVCWKWVAAKVAACHASCRE